MSACPACTTLADDSGVVAVVRAALHLAGVAIIRDIVSKGRRENVVEERKEGEKAHRGTEVRWKGGGGKERKDVTEGSHEGIKEMVDGLRAGVVRLEEDIRREKRRATVVLTGGRAEGNGGPRCVLSCHSHQYSHKHGGQFSMSVCMLF